MHHDSVKHRLLGGLFIAAAALAPLPYATLFAAPDQVTTFLPDVTTTDTEIDTETDSDTVIETTTPASTAKPTTGVEVSTLVVNSESDLTQIVADAKQIVLDAREKNPDLGPLKILLVTRNSEFDSENSTIATPEQVGELIAVNIDNTLRFEVTPTKELSRLIKVPETDPYERAAAGQIVKARTSISIFRFFVAGGVSLVALAISNLPLPAVVGGGVLAGAIAGSLQMKNDVYKNWMISRAIWDKGDHRGSKDKVWIAGYAAWKTARITAVFFSYLTAIQITLGVLGGQTPFVEHPFQWASATAVSAVLATFSEGPWLFVDAERRRQALSESWIKNVDNRPEGEKAATKILMKSQVAALALSAAATFAQVLATSGKDHIAQPLMIAIGGTGGAYYLWKCTNIREYAKNLMQKVKEGFTVAGSVCSTMFGGM